MESEVFIYGLCEAKKGVAFIRYVGMTISPADRYRDHVRSRGATPKEEWIRSVREAGGSISMIVLDKVYGGPSDALYREYSWIVFGKLLGWDLLNVAEFGKRDYSWQTFLSIEDQQRVVHELLRENDRLELAGADSARAMSDMTTEIERAKRKEANIVTATTVLVTLMMSSVPLVGVLLLLGYSVPSELILFLSGAILAASVPSILSICHDCTTGIVRLNKDILSRLREIRERGES